MIDIQALWALMTSDPWALVAALALGLAAMAILLFLARTLLKAVKRHVQSFKRPVEDESDDEVDSFTIVVAVIALAVSAQGMYEVFTHVLQLSPPLNLLFVFLEAGALASALRARKNMRKYGKSGVDGKAVWVIAITSGVFSCLEEIQKGSALGALVRFAAPIVAAWYWERALTGAKKDYERRNAIVTQTLTAQVLARVKDRILIAAKLIDPEGRDVTEATADRYLDRVAVRVSRVRESGSRLDRWKARKAIQSATTHAGLGTDPVRTKRLVGKLAAHGSLDELTALELPSLLEVEESASHLQESGFANRTETRTLTRTESGLKALPNPDSEADSNPDSTRTRTRTEKRTQKRTRTGLTVDYGKLPTDRWEAAQEADARHLDATGRHISAESLRSVLGVGKSQANELHRMLKGLPNGSPTMKAV